MNNRATAVHEQPAPACDSSAPLFSRLSLPIIPHYGPIVRADARRVVVFEALFLLAAAATWLLAETPALKTFAVGLTFPGAGFLHGGSLAGLAIAISLFLSTGLLMLAGMWIFPTLVVVASAVLAAWMVPDAASPGWVAGAWALLPAWMVIQYTWRKRTEAAAMAERSAYNDLLRTQPLAKVAPWVTTPARDFGTEPQPELAREQLAEIRNLLDLALQPLDAYDGYHMIEQKGSSALRNQYILQFYALALTQYTHTPAFTGYESQALRNIITRMQHPINWRYFSTFKAIAEFRWQPDPTEIIGYSGFLGAMVGLYEKLDGDRTYEHPESITFKYSDRLQFKHDFREFSEKIANLYLTDRFNCIPCEPMWYYPFCNSIGMQQMSLVSEFYDLPWFRQLQPLYRQALINEFCTADGRITTARHRWLGIRAPMLDLSSMEFLNAWLTLPVVEEVGERCWAAARQRYFRDGRYIPQGRLRDMDLGNYNTRVSVLPMVTGMLLAHGVGDTDMVDSLRQQVLENADFVDHRGARMIAGASVTANALYTLVHTSRPRALIDLIGKPHRSAKEAGPILAEVSYPEVLVASAHTDGHALSLVLMPGRPPGGKYLLRFAQLKPHGSYRLTAPHEQEMLVADAQGNASARVLIDGRTPVQVTPGNA